MNYEMRKNDIVFFNLHRLYINTEVKYGGFLGIYSLSAFLNSNGYRAQGFSGLLNEGKRIIDELCSANKVKAIGLYCDYENITENIFLSSYIKEKYKLPVFVGGPQATALTKDFFLESGCDAVVRYEGELTVLDLLAYYLDGTGSFEQIKGIMYLADGELIVKQEQELIENLDALPFIDDECYLLPESKNSLTIMTGRGCPFNCAFCHEGHHTRKVRFRSIENVLQEIELYLDRYMGHEDLYILFSDDTFTLIPERVKQLCEGLKELRKKKAFQWFCEGHIHTLYLHPEMLDYMAAAGVKRIQLGIEAGTQEVLDAYRKGSTLEEIEAVVCNCRDKGIEQIYSNIILGGALFTQEVYEKNLAYAKKLITLGKGQLELGVVSYWPLAETSITNCPHEYGIKIVDKEFVTAVGDFPQTETSALSRIDILCMVQEMGREIEQLMMEMLENNVIDEKIILSWFPEGINLKASGRWGTCLLRLPHVYAYYHMLLKKEAFSTIKKSMPENEYYKLHPLRTIPLLQYTKVLDDGGYEVAGVRLQKYEYDVLIYATGKLSLENMYARLLADGSSLGRQQLVTVIKRLEEKHLVIFSKY